MKEKLECLLPRETQTIVLPPSSEWFGEEASLEERAKKRWRRASLAEGAADLEDAGGEGSGASPPERVAKDLVSKWQTDRPVVTVT